MPGPSILLSGTVLAVHVLSPQAPIPRTEVTLAASSGEQVVFTLPGTNGPPVMVAEVPRVEVGSHWSVRLERTPAGLVPRGLGQGMVSQDPRPIYNLNGNHLPDEQLPWVMSLSQEGAHDMGIEATERVVQEALAQWSRVGCSTFGFAYGGLTELGVADDGVNVLAWENGTWDWGGEVAGMSVVRFGDEGEGIFIRETDILFNGVHWTWSEGPGDVYLASPVLNAGSVVTHELGHTTGMDHEYTRVTSTMFYAYLGGDWMATLSGDDHRGLCANYPSGEGACEGDEDCLLDGSTRHCVQIDGLSVCDEVRDAQGAECSRTHINCEAACVFTNATATQGYCTVPCPEGTCPSGWICEQVDLLVPVDAGAVCVPDPDTGQPPDTGPDTGDTGQPQPEPGCGCSQAPLSPLLLLPLILLALRRRPEAP